MMGVWSRLAGEIFLDWLGPRSNLRWIDIGCGSGAFTELIVARYGPVEVQGIDPSGEQLAFARARLSESVAQFHQGDATTLPFPEARFDAAIMALVIFFVPDPVKGVAEMVRVVAPGGMVAAYVWDMMGGGIPLHPIQAEMRSMGLRPPLPPSFEISRMEALRDLWTKADVDAVDTRQIEVRRTFTDFDDFWTTSVSGSSLGPIVAGMPPGNVQHLKARVRKHLPADDAGHITYVARANAVRGYVPK